MKRLLVNIFWVSTILSCFLSGCDTASNTEDPDFQYFIKYYGGDGDQRAKDMLLLPDGTFLLLGNSEQRGSAQSVLDSDLYLVRVDALGNVIREVRFGDNENSVWEATDMELTDDGNIVVLANYLNPAISDSRDIRLIKFSMDGDFIDSVGFGSPAHEYARSVTLLWDGGFILSGTTEATTTFGQPNVPDPDLGDGFKFRVDANLSKIPVSQWVDPVAGYGSRYDVNVKVIQVSSDLFYGFGYTNSQLSGRNPNSKLGLIYFAIDKEGLGLNQAFPGNFPDDVEVSYVHPVENSLGGGVLVIGSATTMIGQSQIFIAKLRPDLTFDVTTENDLLLYGTVSLGRNIRGVAATSSLVGERGFLVVGNEMRTTATNIWLSKIDQDGSVIWSTTLGSESQDDTAAAVAELPDGKIAVLATIGLADSQYKMALIKLNRSGLFLK
jgi:hypothetical protein